MGDHCRSDRFHTGLLSDYACTINAQESVNLGCVTVVNLQPRMPN